MITNPAFAWAENSLTVGTYQFPPFLELSNGKPSGLWIKIITQVLDRCSITYTIKEYPAKRLIGNIVDGTTDLAMASKGISVFEDTAMYSNLPIAQAGVSVYTQKDIPIPKNQSALKGKHILAMRGYSYGGLIKYLEAPENNIYLDFSDSLEALFKKLQAGRADYALGYTNVGDEILKTINIEGVQQFEIFTFDIFFIISKKTPNFQDILINMEAAFKSLHENGTF